jgi:hypothetical protein
MFDKKSLLLVVVSTTGGLIACEIGLRLLTPYGAGKASPIPGIAAAAGSGSLETAVAYVARMGVARGTDRRWFTEDPEPLKPGPVDKATLARYQDFGRRGIPQLYAQFIFNAVFLAGGGCRTDGIFRNFPDKALVFDPPGKTEYPRFRFPADATEPDGLVTNRFGLRGPQIPLEKPPRTIRLAFVGASTTVNPHNFSFSYPEYTAPWLNRFAQANGMDVRFEVLNAGREGLGSTDIAAIVRGELAPLGPDVVVYYEGANQFYAHELMVPRQSQRATLDPQDRVGSHKLPEWIRLHSAIGDLIDRAVAGFVDVGEPAKPSYRIRWPAGVDEHRPDPNHPGLPLDLPRIVRDLDSIRGALQPIGGELVLASFERLAGDGMRLSPVAHEHIYRQLNTQLWPFRYADVRRLTDFQNRVYRAYAESRRIPLLDIAGEMPQDPSLFSDTIHMTEVGERLKAWIAFQQLVPYLRRQIENGILPRTSRQPLPPPPSLTPHEMRVCPGR